MNIDDFQARSKRPGILYVDVYPFHLDEQGLLRFLVLRRRDDVQLPGSWQPVSGKIREGERIREAFVRQVRIKTGQAPVELYKLDIVNSFYDDYYDTVMFVPCAACRLPTTDVTFSEEFHQDARWVTKDEASALLEWAVQIECIEQVSRRLSSSGGFGRFHALPVDA